MGGDALVRNRQKLLVVLLRLWTTAPTTKCDFAREYADTIACLSSGGEITTQLFPGSKRHGRHWKLTPKGVALLWHLADIEQKFLQANVITHDKVSGVKSTHCNS